MNQAVSWAARLVMGIWMASGSVVLMQSPSEAPGTTEIRASLEAGREAIQAADVSMDSSSAEAGQETNRITAIGDSVMLGGAQALQDAMPGITVDAKESRQMTAAIEIVSNMKAADELGDIVVIGLGTNGPFAEDDGQELLDEIGSSRTVYWILSYGQKLSWQEEVNSTIRHLAQTNANVILIDWPSEAEAHPEWLYPDGIHLNPDGMPGYAEFIRSAIED